MRDRQRDTEMEGGGYGENSVYLDFFFFNLLENSFDP